MTEDQKLYFVLGILYVQSKFLSQENKWTIADCVQMLIEQLEEEWYRE